MIINHYQQKFNIKDHLSNRSWLFRLVFWETYLDNLTNNRFQKNTKFLVYVF